MKLIKNKRGQITVFIILGIVLLFAFLFIFQIVEQLQAGKLKQEEEKVLGRLFSKEGLRLYVESCLEKELEEGLILLGRQGGRLWQEQPGSRDRFEESLSGLISPNQEKISYALTKGFYPADNQYPCQRNPLPPAFCRYLYPNSSILPSYAVKFGENKLPNLEKIQSQLERFLKNQTTTCIQELIQTNVSSTLEVNPGNVEMGVKILKDGIKAAVSYPLTVSSAGEEFFHLAEFDFFYPSKFYQLLDAAVLNPLSFDWSFVDFDYEKESLELPYFEHLSFDSQGAIITRQEPLKKEEYQSLALTFEKEELEAGDTLFRFTADNILKNQPYLFQFARQNRPPALDYIEKNACRKDCEEEKENQRCYDYLAIVGKEGINIVPQALDPDEDQAITYTFEADPRLSGEYKEGQFLAPDPAPNWYDLKITASDEHGASDSQKVKILVDRPIKTKVSLYTPYTLSSPPCSGQGFIPYQECFSGEVFKYFVSKEDPVFVEITLPTHSLVQSVEPQTTLEYNKEDNFHYILPRELSLSGEGGCFSLPWTDSKTCDINSYSEEDLKNWPDKLKSSSFNHFRELTEEGKLDLNFDIVYCEGYSQSSPASVELVVKECIPHQNSEHPFAYPYHETKVDPVTNAYSEEEIPPFLATHSCCRPSDWSVYRKEDNHICFKGPEELGCFGGSSVSAKAYPNQLLEKKIAQANCDGQRGNICGGDLYSVYSYQRTCGDSQYPTCSKVAQECQNKPPFSYQTGKNGFWCHGPVGCGLNQKTCTSAIVSDSNLDFRKVDSINYHCGCNKFQEGKTGDDERKPCLSLQTGKEGICGPSGNCG